MWSLPYLEQLVVLNKFVVKVVVVVVVVKVVMACLVIPCKYYIFVVTNIYFILIDGRTKIA
jgi:hypothetical protein